MKSLFSHIKSFPTVESHYTRKDTNRKYLSPELNIKKMYELYKDKYLNTGRKPVRQTSIQLTPFMNNTKKTDQYHLMYRKNIMNINVGKRNLA